MTTICKRCNRPLKNEKSQERGYGHTCYEKEFGKLPEREKAIKSSKVRKMKGYFND